MFRPLWSRLREAVYDFVGNLFYTQSEIDDNISNRFDEIGVSFTNDATDIPGGAKRRNRQFWTHEDAIKYITDGIPTQYVWVLEIPDWDDEGNSVYYVFVEGS